MKKLYIIGALLCVITPLSKAWSQTLSLSWPLDKSVIQHSGGYANVSIAGQLVGCPDSYTQLQMRIEKLDKYGSYSSLTQDYTNISRDNGGLGIFNESAYLEKGWYHIIVKAINSGGSTVAINDVKVGVGNVFIIAGQSNAQGIFMAVTTGPTLPSDTAYDCVVSNDWTGECDWVTSPSPAYIPFPLFPVFSKITSSSKIAPNGPNRWAYARLGNLQVDAAGAPVAFFNTAYSDSDIAAWKTSSDGGSVSTMPHLVYPCSNVSLPDNSGLPYKRLQQSLNYYASLFGSAGVLWHQGEAETFHQYSNPSYNSDYVTKLNYVISKSRTHYGYTIPWYISNSATLIAKFSGSWTYNIVNTTVQGNQSTVATSNSSGAHTDNRNNDYRHPEDFTHINENPSYGGLTALADSWNSNIGSSTSGITAQSLPAVTLSYNSGTDIYTAYVPSGYSDYMWITGTTSLGRGVGSGSGANSYTLSGSGVRCWLKNSTGNWTLSPTVYAQSCRSGARKSVSEQCQEKNSELDYNLSVFPNPATEEFNIKFDIPLSGDITVNIIDQNGRLLKNVTNSFHEKGSFQYPIDISRLNDGVYLCQLKVSDIAIVKKFIVNK